MNYFISSKLGGLLFSLAIFLGFFGFTGFVLADTGTTFTEQFGEGSIVCWTAGPSTCNQKWNIGAGNVHSIAASPGTPPTAAGASSLKITNTGTAGYIYTTGSFPSLPSGQTFDAYFDLDVVSHSIAAFGQQTIFYVSNASNGGSPVFSLAISNRGSNITGVAAFSSSNSAYATIATTTWYAVRVHIESGTNASYVSVDSSSCVGADTATCKRFTVNAQAGKYVVVGAASNTSVATYYIGDIRINSSLGGGNPPSLLADFLGGVNGATVTSADLNSGTHCGNGSWAGTVASTTFTTTQSQNLPSSVASCGVSYSGNTGISVQQNLASSDTSQYIFSTTGSTTAAGFFYRTEVLPTESTYYDMAYLKGVNGESATVQNVGNGSSRHFQLEISKNSTLVYGDIPYTANRWYWVTIGYSAGGTHQLSVYDATSWALVGSTSGPAQTTSDPQSFAFLHVGANTSATTQYAQFSNILVDYYPGTVSFPLLPDTTAPTVTAFTIPSTAASTIINVNAFTATDNAGVAGYLVNESATTPSSADAGWSVSAPTTYTFTTGGSKTLYAWAKDATGNISQSASGIVVITLDSTAPILSSGSPSTTLPSGTTGATLSLTTDESATCKYGTTANTAYASISNTFTTTGGTTHSSSINGLIDGTSYTYYVRCADTSSNTNLTDYSISFSVAAAAVTAVSTHSSSGNASGVFMTQYSPLFPQVVPPTSSFTQSPPSLNSKYSRKEIKDLQIFLNSHGFLVAESGPGSQGEETEVFGQKTEAALIRFQEAHADQISLQEEKGTIGKMTLSKIRDLTNPPQTLPMVLPVIEKPLSGQVPNQVEQIKPVQKIIEWVKRLFGFL